MDPTPVSAVMTTDVVTVSPTISVEDAVSLLRDRGITGAPVVDDDGTYLGLLDDSDILLSESRVHAPSAIEFFGAYIPLPGSQNRFEEEVRHALARNVADVAQVDAPTLSPEATVTDVATAMVEHEVSRVTILDADGKVVGLVSRGDLIGALGAPPPTDS